MYARARITAHHPEMPVPGLSPECTHRATLEMLLCPTAYQAFCGPLSLLCPGISGMTLDPSLLFTPKEHNVRRSSGREKINTGQGALRDIFITCLARRSSHLPRGLVP